MRLFLAVNIPHDVRAAIHDATEAVRSAAPDAAWVAGDRLHMTLRFLGDQPDEIVPRLEEQMRHVASRHAVIEVSVGGVGAFPTLRRPKIVWIGVESVPRLELLHHDVEVACDGLGLGVEGRPFRPHVTLGRLRGRESAAGLRAMARAARAVNYTAYVDVESIDIMKSDLSPDGSRYTLLRSAALRDR